MRSGSWGCAALVLALASPAAAAPSVWRRAASPSTVALERGQRAADDHLRTYENVNRIAGMRRKRLILERAVQALERGGAATSSRVGPRLHLAQVLQQLYRVTGKQDALERAAEHLAFVGRNRRAPVLRRAEALNDLAICYARLGRHGDEVKAYEAAITLNPNPDARALMLANQAEGFMASGRIIDAVRGYRAALSLTSPLRLLGGGATTLWGLAVALDRSGDLEGALASIAEARRYDPDDTQINGDGWFYSPPHDEAWYQALGQWQHARAMLAAPADERDPTLIDGAYADAIAGFRSFISRAPEDDPWLAIAQRRMADCEAERRRRSTAR